VAPLAAAVAVLGIVLGCVARSAGFGAAATVIMSAATFAGSPQFAAVSVVRSGGTALAAAGAAALVAARLVPMGATVAPELRSRGWRRVLLAQLVVDETWAVAYDGNGRFSRERLIGAAILLYAVHVGSTALGAIIGATLVRPERFGVDAAFPALFLAMLWPQLHEPGVRTLAIAGAVVALALTPITPAGVPILAATALAWLPLGRDAALTDADAGA
jgi:4-azaleucine resistance transporter AzlC